MGEGRTKRIGQFQGQECSGKKAFSRSQLWGSAYVPKTATSSPAYARDHLTLGLKPGQKDGCGALVHVQAMFDMFEKP